MALRRKNARKNELDRITKLAATLGLNVDNLLEQIPLTEIGEEAQIRAEIEAESVIFYIETKGKDFKQKVCKNPNCMGLFLHTFQAVDYCSDACRAWVLAQHGIIWNFHRKRLSQRWNVKGKGYVPKIIGVEATAALVQAGYLEVDEDKYVPEVPYDPNFNLDDLKENTDDEGNED
ncbi:hypothetical protein [Streptomyces anandii]|uniref:hypothetical protein n=1 Tax=Streptomyces anandii TaxID=285454 RepID=UPI0036C987C4